MPRCNRQVNPGFAVATTGWAASATTAAIRRIASTGPGVGTEFIGDGYAKVRPVFRTTAAQNGLADVIAGRENVLSVYAYHGAGATKQCRVDADIVNAAGSVVRSVSQTLNVPNQTWTRFAIPFTPQSGEVAVSTYVAFFSATSQSVPVESYVAIAAAMLDEVLGEYRDGNSPGWQWNGTPGLSASQEAVTGPEPGRFFLGGG